MIQKYQQKLTLWYIVVFLVNLATSTKRLQVWYVNLSVFAWRRHIQLHSVYVCVCVHDCMTSSFAMFRHFWTKKWSKGSIKVIPLGQMSLHYQFRHPPYMLPAYHGRETCAADELKNALQDDGTHCNPVSMEKSSSTIGWVPQSSPLKTPDENREFPHGLMSLMTPPSFASRGELGARATAPGPGVTSRRGELGTGPPRTGTSPNGNFTREIRRKITYTLQNLQ